MFFVRGLVSTSEDFGLQGALPSHTKLLDWLSYQFVDSGWNVKQLLKTIVLSATYRQNSNPSQDLLREDPENILLARGSALRLPAEMIRDSALFASGLLVESSGGPPVKPYQPDGLWKEKSGSVYQRELGEGSHRRSLYTYWKRTSPPPAMMTLDASNREVCVVRRQVTMTPLQILVLLNDPQYVEAARALAQEAMLAQDGLEEQLNFLFRKLITRTPSEAECRVLASLYADQREAFAANGEAVDQLLAIGDHPVDDQVDTLALAAMTVVAEGLMTYDETVMKR